MNFFQRINPSNTPSSLADADRFVILKEKILQYGLIGISVIGTILVPMVTIRDIAAGDWFPRCNLQSCLLHRPVNHHFS